MIRMFPGKYEQEIIQQKENDEKSELKLKKNDENNTNVIDLNKEIRRSEKVPFGVSDFEQCCLLTKKSYDFCI